MNKKHIGLKKSDGKRADYIPNGLAESLGRAFKIVKVG